MTLSAYALVTLQKAKEYLQITTPSAYDSQIEDLISMASDLVENFTDRKFISREYTEYYDGAGDSTLMLDQYPVTAVASLYDDPDRAYASTSLIPSEDYILSVDEGIIELEGDLIFSRAKKNLKVVYTAGYAIASIPYTLQHCVLELLAVEYGKIVNKRQGVSGSSVGGKSITYLNESLPVSVEKRLQFYSKHGRQDIWSER